MRGASKKNKAKRRRFLFATFSFLTLAALGRVKLVTVPGKPRHRPDNTNAERMISALFNDRGAARAVGRRYLKGEPADANPATLLAALPKTDSTVGTEALRKTIKHLRDQDFRDGNIVLVDGWVLARTEARLCALAALT